MAQASQSPVYHRTLRRGFSASRAAVQPISVDRTPYTETLNLCCTPSSGSDLAPGVCRQQRDDAADQCRQDTLHRNPEPVLCASWGPDLAPGVRRQQRDDAADQRADRGHDQEHHAPALHAKRPLPAQRRRQEPRKPACHGVARGTRITCVAQAVLLLFNKR